MCDAGRARTGLTGGASCMVVSEHPLEVEERDRERGVDEGEAMDGFVGVAPWVRLIIVGRGRKERNAGGGSA